MKLKKAIKRIAALGIGATMMGATILGATAAADLANYPSPFIAEGKFAGKIVVGNEAKADDVVGSIDIATSLQFASTTTSSTTTGAVTTFTGDAWKVGTSTKLLEMAENLDTTAAPKIENIHNITSFIDGSDLNGLAEGSVSTDKGTAAYSQYLHFENKWRGATMTALVGSEYVMYMENDQDELGDFFYIKNSEQIAKYEMEFKTSFQADIEDSGGSATSGGLYLSDYEGEIINMIGMDYEIVKARKTSTYVSGVALTLMGGAIKTTMQEGETKTFTIDNKDYTVTVSSITDTGTIEAKFEINGETTKAIAEGNSDTLSDGTEIGVTELMPNEAGDPTGDIVEFYLGASKVYLKDTKIYDGISSNSLEVGNEKIDDAKVIITGTDDNSTFSIDSIKINVSAKDDYYVPPGGKLSELMDEPQGLMNWDIEYRGLADVATEEIKVKASGSNQYDLEFVDGDGYPTSVPIAYSSAGTTLHFGDNDDDLIIRENKTIVRNDYIIVTDESQEAGERNSYGLRYKGADKSSDDSPNIRFLNLGDGKSIEKTHKRDATSGLREATLKLGGASFKVVNTSSSLANNFDVLVDLDADGDAATATVGRSNLGGADTIKPTSKNGAEIEIGNRTNTKHIDLIMRVVDTDDYETLAPNAISLNISASGGEVRLSENGTFALKSPDDDRYTEYGYTTLGAKMTRTKPTDSPQEFTVEWPIKQRTPEVFVASGKVTYSATGGGAVESTTVQKIEVGAAVLASEVKDVTTDNLILVGGPCANAATREVTGTSLATCAQGFEEGKAKIKLYEQATGKVALLVAGYSAMDTRRAARVLANYADYALSGKEVEVSGTSLTDITVSKVA